MEQPLLEKVSIIEGFENTGIWGKFTFQWLNPLFRCEKLGLHHIPNVPESEKAARASVLLEENLLKEKTEDTSLPKAVFDTVWRALAINAIFAGVCTLASYVGPYLMANFVEFVSGKDEEMSHGYGLALATILFFSKTVESLSERQRVFGGKRIAVRIRAALMVLIYNKSISMRYGGTDTNGQMVNLINGDVENIGDFCMSIHQIWLLPIQVLLAMLILYKNLGVGPSMAGLISTILVMVCNTPLARLQQNFQSSIMNARDARIKATSETLRSMRILKMHSWESTFMKKILQLREIEGNWIKRSLYTKSAIAFLFWTSPTIVSAATFGVCILLNTPLTAGAVLSALATFRVLQDPIYNLPELISNIAQTKVSIHRVQGFIRTNEELEKMPPLHPISNSSKIAIEIEIGEYAWDTSNPCIKRPTIKISEKMNINRGEKVAICGPVGGGKSSFICSIIGEIPMVSGEGIKVYGSKAFAPQSPWIQTGTIRDNVLFGKEMDKYLYKDVLEGCALNKDIEMWEHGDLTVVGERGINLSGGQKQRIQLARAIYSDSDVYFLDDPFSAVDARTGAHLFERCMMQLLAEKTVIYVTHQLQFLSASNLVLVLKEGRILQSGTYSDLIANTNGELFYQMDAHRSSLDQVNQPKSHKSSTKTESPQTSHVIETKTNLSCSNNSFIAKSEEEEVQTGRVKWNVYSTYITSAYKGAFVPVILICHILFQGLQIGSSYWLTWATEEEHSMSKTKLVSIYLLISAGSSLFVLARGLLVTSALLKTSEHLFHGMITSVFRAPISFFDRTPSSRILDRSSKDQSIVDTDFPFRLAGLVFALIQLLSIVMLMSYVAWPVFLLFLVIFGVSIYYKAYYSTTARDLARMVGVRKSPILHHITESLTGAAVIRCHKQELRFSMKNHCLVDEFSRVVFHNSGTMEWLSLRVNFLFNLGFFHVLIILVSLPKSAIHPSLAGLVATYGLHLTEIQAWAIMNICNVENKVISVERILQYTKLPIEAPLVIENNRPIPEWPVEGLIQINNIYVQYNPSLPVVLKGITCTFPGQTKIGIVGRTGSGKSTLIQVLFRVVEPSQGQILVDGVDICGIGLQDLRSKFSIIPQDPTLFQGSMRINLDPLDKHSDKEIWEVLNKCRLAEMVKRDPRLLEATVEEDGLNWSLGQRQLLCLARVLLQGRKILVLDEATASVDTATDNVMQRTLREETLRCTVITVAHRIPTIIDTDYVMVLDEGKVVEYASPSQLLQDNSSEFSKLVNEFRERSSTTDVS